MTTTFFLRRSVQLYRYLLSALAFGLSLAGLWLLFSTLTPASAKEAERPQPVAPVARTSALTPTLSFTFTDSGQNLGDTESSAIVLGDLDNDGDLDALVGATGDDPDTLEAEDRVWLNDGQGRFVDSGQRLGGLAHARDAALGDLDRDGDLDAVVANEDAPNLVFLNDGQGGLIPNGEDPGTNLKTYGVALGDLDGDGDFEIVLAGENTTEVWLNNGQGLFSNSGQALAPGNKVAIGRMNGDARLDLVLVNNSEVMVYANLGAGAFSQTVSIACPALCTNLALGDLDSDTDLDVFVTQGEHADCAATIPNGGVNLVFRNNGLGMLTDSGQQLSTNSLCHSAVALGDLDNDGDLDAVVGINPDPASRFWLNDGTGIFTTTEGYVIPQTLGLFSTAIALGDLNNDHALDIFLVNQDSQPDKVFFNNGQLRFAKTNLDLATSPDSAVALGDLNGDGTLDAFVGRGECDYADNTIAKSSSCASFDTIAYPSQVWFNDGAGTFADSGQSLGNSVATDVKLGDLNGDTRLDAFVANKDGLNQVFLNDGTGTFTLGDNPGDNSRAVALGDLDEDGDLDAVLARGTSDQSDLTDQVWLNDGGGSFTDSGQRLGDSPAAGVALGDMDEDGDLDAVILDAGGQNGTRAQSHIWFNDGNGNFTDGLQQLYTTDPTDVKLGDLDRDGDLDVYVANQYYGQPDRIFFNDGTGRLTVSEQSFELGTTSGVDLTDGDGDGDLDVFAANLGGLTVHLNDGTGRFQSFKLTEGEYDGGAAGDLNGDGQPDFFALQFAYPGGDSGLAQIWLNHLNENIGIGLRLTQPGLTAPANYYASPVILNQASLPIRFTLTIPNTQTVEAVNGYFSFNGGGQWFPALKISNTLTQPLASGTYTYHWNVYGSGFFGESDNVVFRLVAYPLVRPTINGVPGPYQWPYLATQTFPFRMRGTQVRVISNTLPAANALVYRLPVGQVNDAQPLGNATSAFRTDPHGYLRGRGRVSPGDRLAALLPLNSTTRLEIYPGPTLPVSITDVSTTTATLTITNGGQIQDLNLVNVSGTHTWISDLSFILQSPQGTQVEVMAQSCGSEDDFNLSFDDEATSSFWPCPPTNGGSYLPSQALSAFDGQNSTGTWRLLIIDHGVGDSGVLNSWGLALTTQSSSAALYYTSATPNTTGLSMTIASTGGVQTLTVSSARPLVLFNLNVSLEWDARNDPAYLNKLKFDLSRVSEFLYDWTNGQMALGTITVYQDREQWNTAHIRLYGTNGLHPNADLGGIVGAAGLTETAVSNLGVTSTITYRPGQVRMAAIWSRFGGGGSTGEDWPRTLAHELAHYLLFQDDAYIRVNAQGQFFPLAQCANTAMTDPYREDYSEFKLPAEWSPACDDTLGARTTGRSEWETILKFYPALAATTNPGPVALPLGVTRITYADPGAPNTTLAVPVFYMTANSARYVASNMAKAILYQPTQGRLLDVGRPVDDRITAYGARPSDRLCVYDAQALKTGCEIVSAGDTQLTLVDVPSNWQPDIIATPSSSRTVEVYVGNVPPGVVLQAQLYPNNGPASAVLTLTQRSPGMYSTTTQLASPALAAHVVVWVNEPEPRREAISSYSIGGSPVSGGKKKPSKAPVNSNDGEVTLYTIATFPDGEFYALQRATYVPPIPSWLTLVGPGYRILKSSGAPSLSQSAIGFNYDEGAVPPGEERFLQVYYYQNNTWVPLTTTLDTDRNTALAPTQAAGLYVLVSSFQVRLPAAGWNLFAYPVQATRPVTEALLSIAGQYTTVYGYVVTDTVNPWRLYDVQAASKGYVNDLLNLEYGNGYWINVSAAAVLKFKGESSTAAPFAPDTNPPFALPPATLYGLVPARDGFVPMAGMTLTAFINGVACGQAVTRDYGGQVVYVLNVFADGMGSEGCGASGRVVTVKAGATTLGTVAWSVGAVQEVTLAPANLQLFLPLIQR